MQIIAIDHRTWGEVKTATTLRGCFLGVLFINRYGNRLSTVERTGNQGVLIFVRGLLMLNLSNNVAPNARKASLERNKRSRNHFTIFKTHTRSS